MGWSLTPVGAGRVNTTWARDPLAVAVLTLAVHRLTRMGLLDTMPFGALRNRLIKRNPSGHLAELLTCPWCLGWWMSAAVVLAACTLPRRVWQPIAVALAVSSVAALLPMGE
jgi:hypothetical protein